MRQVECCFARVTNSAHGVRKSRCGRRVDQFHFRLPAFSPRTARIAAIGCPTDRSIDQLGPSSICRATETSPRPPARRLPRLGPKQAARFDAMAEYETTPDALRRATQSQNSRAHSVRTVATPQLEGERPPARPVFLEQPLFINALAGPSRQPPALGTKSVNAVAATSVPMQTSRVGGKALHHLGDSNMAFHHDVAAAHSRKRAAGEAEDDENAEPASRNAKRARAYGDQEGNATAAAVAAAAKRRQQRKPERGPGADKLHQDTQQWRQKYRKAFPSFTFYFDAIDEATQLTLGVAVKKLGAVRFTDCILHSSCTHTPLSPAVGRQLLLKEGDARRHGSADSDRRLRF